MVLEKGCTYQNILHYNTDIPLVLPIDHKMAKGSDPSDYPTKESRGTFVVRTCRTNHKPVYSYEIGIPPTKHGTQQFNIPGMYGEMHAENHHLPVVPLHLPELSCI